MQLTVQVTLICSCVGLGKTTRAVLLQAADATQQKQTNKQKFKQTKQNTLRYALLKFLPNTQIT